MRYFARLRKIDGKLYSLYSTRESKRSAQYDAKELRGRGHFARVIPTEKFYDNIRVWLVYARRLPFRL